MFGRTIAFVAQFIPHRRLEFAKEVQMLPTHNRKSLLPMRQPEL
jgi:hypothetical protein